MGKYVAFFDEAECTSVAEVGGKGANLGEMWRAGFPVPGGFCITTTAYRRLLETSAKMGHLLDSLNRMGPDQLDEIRALGEEIRSELSALMPPYPLLVEIIAAWTKLGEEGAYAVRSSATAEDLPDASFAGQQDTYLNVRGIEQLLAAVQKCWASLFTDRAIVYRARNGFDHRTVLLSVVVQRMVFPEVSGIMFTADPITGHRHTVSIDAGFGLGEALVSGIVTADQYKVRDKQIIQKQIAKKEQGIFPLGEGGTEQRKLALEKQQAQVLSDGKIMELAELGERIEQHYGVEQDIEWCVEEGRIYIVQSRPVTSLYPLPPRTDDLYHVYISYGHKQMMTDYMKPMGVSLIRTLMPFDKETAREESKSFLEVGGRLYMDLTYMMALPSVRQKIAKNTIDDDDLSALKQAVLREEFIRRAPVQGVKRRVYRMLRPMLGSIARMLLKVGKVILLEDPQQALRQATDADERNFAHCERTIGQLRGADRIRYIQEFAGRDLFVGLLDSLAYAVAGFVALPMVERRVKKWLGEELEAAVHISPPGNVTSEMGLMIGDLADLARTYPAVSDYLQRAEDRTFYEELPKREGGSEFLTELLRFMEKYGMRAQGEIDVTRVRYREAPTMLVPAIMSHMRSNAPREHREKFAQGEREADQAIASLLGRIRASSGGAGKAKRLSRLLAIYRHTVGIRELPKYYLICYFGLFREAILEEGESLAKQGMIETREDVFYLSLDELAMACEHPQKEPFTDIIRSRKAQEIRDQKRTPPRVMTSDGEVFSPQRSNEHAPSGALLGIPVSAGVVEGYVKVVRRLEEGELNKGDILVAPYTDPGWTPLFHSAKALVTEIGGLMTHGSVVAREYGIPAVVGVENATQLLKDGQYIRVDGTNGYVEILNGEEATGNTR